VQLPGEVQPKASRAEIEVTTWVTKHAGGDGIVREIEFLTAADVTILSDRRARGPYGLNGGKAGKPGRNSLLRRKKNLIVPAKTNFMSQPGDVLRIETPGGGGWGRK